MADGPLGRLLTDYHSHGVYRPVGTITLTKPREMLEYGSYAANWTVIDALPQTVTLMSNGTSLYAQFTGTVTSGGANVSKGSNRGGLHVGDTTTIMWLSYTYLADSLPAGWLIELSCRECVFCTHKTWRAVTAEGVTTGHRSTKPVCKCCADLAADTAVFRTLRVWGDWITPTGCGTH